MINILSRIVSDRQFDLSRQKKRLPLQILRENTRPRDGRFLKSLQSTAAPFLIAEIKKASPSRGVMVEHFDPPAIAQLYTKGGVNAISVLTEERYFHGNLRFISDVREVTALPILRKDFIIDEYQIYEAAHAGADTVLLIVSILSPQQLSEYLGCARALGMEPLVETHTGSEIETAIAAGAEVIGINNRNLSDLGVSLDTTVTLAPLAKNKIVISESGINTRDDILRMVNAGAHGVLIGEAIMCAEDMPAVLCELIGRS